MIIDLENETVEVLDETSRRSFDNMGEAAAANSRSEARNNTSARSFAAAGVAVLRLRMSSHVDGSPVAQARKVLPDGSDRCPRDGWC